MIKKKFARQLLSTAFKLHFPKAKLKGGRAFPLCFYGDFELEALPSYQEISFIDEKMAELLKKPPQIEVLEMLSSVAAEMCFHHKEPFLAEKVKASRAMTVKIVRMGHVIDVLEEDSTPYNEANISLIKIAYSKALEDGSCRIMAVIAEDKEELKEKIKRVKLTKDANHVAIGRKNFIFEESKEGIVWLEKGEKLKEDLLQMAKACHIKFVKGWISTPTFDPLRRRFDRYIKEGRNCAEFGCVMKLLDSPEEGLFNSKLIHTDLLRIYGNRSDMTKALDEVLDALAKVWNFAHLTFSYHLKNSFDDLLIKSKKGAISFFAQDLYQKERPLSSLSLTKKEGDLYQLDVTFFLNLEAFIAVSIEKNQI